MRCRCVLLRAVFREDGFAACYCGALKRALNQPSSICFS